MIWYGAIKTTTRGGCLVAETGWLEGGTGRSIKGDTFGETLAENGERKEERDRPCLANEQCEDREEPLMD